MRVRNSVLSRSLVSVSVSQVNVCISGMRRENTQILTQTHTRTQGAFVDVSRPSLRIWIGAPLHMDETFTRGQFEVNFSQPRGVRKRRCICYPQPVFLTFAFWVGRRACFRECGIDGPSRRFQTPSAVPQFYSFRTD